MALEIIRKESQDIYNRLHSIHYDSLFIKEVQCSYPDTPVVPNLRCGAWYTDVASRAAYFKSTDGHFGAWSFNLRRPNMHILPILAENGSIMIVDSTRAGKSIPDALSKTVPIWCAVINTAVKIKFHKTDWDADLYTPPQAVSPQEHLQIQSRISAWAQDLLASSYTIIELPRPIRPIWITPATSTFPVLPSAQYLTILCVSASKKISDGLDRRGEGGYTYIQGSGDDHELWGMGLTPAMYWQHRDRLLDASQTSLPDLVKDLVGSSMACTVAHSVGQQISSILNGKIKICANSQAPDSLAESTSHIHISSTMMASHSPHKIHLANPPGKAGQHLFLTRVLPAASEFALRSLNRGEGILISCSSGTDESVGVAVAVLAQYFDGAGEFVGDDQTERDTLTKHSIRTRLEWVIAQRPEANPSRATMKRVNEFLLSPRRKTSPASLAPLDGTDTLDAQ